MDIEPSSRRVQVVTLLTLDQKQSLERRAKTLGVSVSELVRTSVTNPKRRFEESLVREWVAVGLQLQKIQSHESDQREIQPILDKIKSLIQQSLSQPNDRS